MLEVIDLLALQTIVFRFVLQVTRALTVSVPPTRLGIDAETIKDRLAGGGRQASSMTPIIPASTLKGVWRTSACYAANEMGLVCCGTKSPDLMGKMHLVFEDGGARLVTVHGRRVCHVCALFGLSDVPSAVYFEDARPLDYLVAVGVRPGIEIDDYSGTARRGRLYFVEVIEPGSLFTVDVGLVLDGRFGESFGLCQAVELLIRASEYVEAVGVGRGAAKPYLYSVVFGGSVAREPSEAAKLLNCLDLEPVFQRVWLPEKLVLP